MSEGLRDRIDRWTSLAARAIAIGGFVVFAWTAATGWLVESFATAINKRVDQKLEKSISAQPVVLQSEAPLVIVDHELPQGCVHIAGTLGSGECPGGAGCDWRSVRCTVTFGQTFASPPVVTLALAGFDTFEETGGRVQLRMDGVATDRFNFLVHTWHDSRLWGVWVNWIAVGTPSD